MAKDKKRILIINNESRYIEGLKETVDAHTSGRAEVDTVNIKDVKSKIKDDDVPYDGIILGGSHKRKYDDKEVQEIIASIDKHNEANPDKQVALYGICLGHQAVAHYHKGKVEDLGKYQKGDRKIQLIDGSEARTHKHHRWGVTEASDLEVIAESTVKDAKDEDVRIIEAAKHPTKPYVTTQGHAAKEGHAQELLHQWLDNIYKPTA
tara:strand:+ start:672 stop:1292 length:621 start_codon:yes stop_codon:yes gene_type:complete